MKKLTISLCILGFALTAKAQVGVNTTNPRGVFNVDGAKNNTNTTTPATVATESTDDVVVDATGKVGIGTAIPSNKLEINTTGANTGIKLPNGASSGKVLVSDTDGNGVWQSSAVQYQTIIASSGEAKTYNIPVHGQWVLYDKLTNVIADDVKTIYGTNFGWNVTNQNYVVPRTGKYRITANIYYTYVYGVTVPGENFRATVLSSKQGVIPSMPFSSITTSTSDQVGFFTGIAVLEAGDTLSLRITDNYGTVPVTIWGGSSHTLLTIESL